MFDKHTSGPLRVVELGCFDGRAVDYMPARLEKYAGHDANWENGLELGRERLKDRPETTSIETTDPDTLKEQGDKSFNVAVRSKRWNISRRRS